MGVKITNRDLWWGPPKKFSPELEERKVSWLELFYDLVYVIAISKITHYLASTPTWSGVSDYIYLFIFLYWGWINGSLYHDLHGSTGVRTSFMTFWQIMLVAVFVVTLSSPVGSLRFNATVGTMLLQFYITYMWWSVGIYDKVHRKFNLPYTICYLLSLGIFALAYFLEQPYVRILYYVALLINFAPPFFSRLINRNGMASLSLSKSMSERLGLFTIIIFGESVLGVINGTIDLNDLNPIIWLNFSLGIIIVFGLW